MRALTGTASMTSGRHRSGSADRESPDAIVQDHIHGRSAVRICICTTIYIQHSSQRQSSDNEFMGEVVEVWSGNSK